MRRGLTAAQWLSPHADIESWEKPLSRSSWFAATAIALAVPLSAAPPIGLQSGPAVAATSRPSAPTRSKAAAPATRAETKTVDYIVDQFREAGLEPGGDVVDGKRQWTQAVPLLKSDIVGTPQLTLDLGNGQRLNLAQGDLITVRSPTNGQSAINLANAPLLFVGYGVSAPERNWDDFKGVDVKGKLLVELINDPDFEGGDGDFGGKAMTYYGRWTYKYEEAARRGAAGVLIVHETAPASYGWATSRTPTPSPCSTSSARIRRPSTRLRKLDPARLAEQIFAASGLNFDQAKAAAKLRGLQARRRSRRRSPPTSRRRPRPSPRTMSSASCRARNIPTRRSSTRAHWDHLGIGKPDASGDAIYNGAVDNGTGIAQLIEQARAFARGPRPDRSVVFLAVTAEEKGLLGSEYYAAHPLYPLGKTVGGAQHRRDGRVRARRATSRSPAPPSSTCSTI